jgi:hypothetical protein
MGDSMPFHQEVIKMGKKKKNKGLIKKVDSETKSLVSFLIHGEDYTETESLTKGLLDEEEFVDPERMSQVIKKRVERGESASEIAYYSHKVLTAVCSHVQIPDRSRMTRKKQMAVALVKYFGGKKKQWKDV